MRPRRARLGCFGPAMAVVSQFVASMRPRRARLGCGRSLSRSSKSWNRFNEAEARAPRMPPQPQRAPPGWRGVNEAEARAPRMHERVLAAIRINRCFNEAEARAPRMPFGKAMEAIREYKLQ